MDDKQSPRSINAASRPPLLGSPRGGIDDASPDLERQHSRQTSRHGSKSQLPTNNNFTQRLRDGQGRAKKKTMPMFLDSLVDLCLAVDPPCAEQDCGCACHHRSADTPENLVYELVKVCAKLVCSVPVTKDAEVQAEPTIREVGTACPTAEQMRQMKWVTDAGSQAAYSSHATGTSMTSNVNTNVTFTQTEIALASHDSDTQTETKKLKHSATQVGSLKLVQQDSCTQATPETCEQALQAQPVARESCTQLEMGELLEPRNQRRVASTSVQRRAHSCCNLNSDPSAYDHNRGAESLRRIAFMGQGHHLGDAPGVMAGFGQHLGQPDFAQASPQFGAPGPQFGAPGPHFGAPGDPDYRRQQIAPGFGQHMEPEPEDHGRPPEEMLRELSIQQVSAESSFTTKSVGVQAAALSTDAVTSTAVPSRRTGCQTDTCFVIEKRGRVPVRIGGGYHVLPTDETSPGAESRFPNSDVAWDPPVAESTPNLPFNIPMAFGYYRPQSPERDPVQSGDGHLSQQHGLPVHAVNGLVYGEHVPDTDRFVHGAVAAASDIERFMVGAYNAPSAEMQRQMHRPTSPGAGVDGSGNAAMSGDVGQALLAMYRVMRPRDRQDGSPPGPSPQVIMGPAVRSSGSRPDSRPASAVSASSGRRPRSGNNRDPMSARGRRSVATSQGQQSRPDHRDQSGNATAAHGRGDVGSQTSRPDVGSSARATSLR